LRRAARLHTGRLTSRGSAGHVAEHAMRRVPMSTLSIGAVQSLRRAIARVRTQPVTTSRSNSLPPPTVRRAFGDPHVDEGRPGLVGKPSLLPKFIPTCSMPPRPHSASFHVASSRCRHRPRSLFAHRAPLCGAGHRPRRASDGRRRSTTPAAWQPTKAPVFYDRRRRRTQPSRCRLINVGRAPSVSSLTITQGARNAS
jgi:hypothetical protein